MHCRHLKLNVPPELFGNSLGFVTQSGASAVGTQFSVPTILNFNQMSYVNSTGKRRTNKMQLLKCPDLALYRGFATCHMEPVPKHHDLNIWFSDTCFPNLHRLERRCTSSRAQEVIPDQFPDDPTGLHQQSGMSFCAPYRHHKPKRHYHHCCRRDKPRRQLCWSSCCRFGGWGRCADCGLYR